MRKILLSTVLVLASFPVMAQEAPTSETMVVTTDAVEQPTSDFPALFAAICGSRAVLSDEARIACETGAMPSVIADGSRWSQRGVGSEFNTLARNLGAF